MAIGFLSCCVVASCAATKIKLHVITMDKGSGRLVYADESKYLMVREVRVLSCRQIRIGIANAVAGIKHLPVYPVCEKVGKCLEYESAFLLAAVIQAVEKQALEDKVIEIIKRKLIK